MEESLKEELIRTSESTKQAHKRIDGLESKVGELSDVYIALTKMDSKINNVETDVVEIKTDIKDMKNNKASSGVKWYETKVFETSVKCFWIFLILLILLLAGREIFDIAKVMPK